MPFDDMNEADLAYLRRSIEDGKGVVVLGAGASANSRNRAGPIPMGRKLASILADNASIPYDDGDTLTDVLTAVVPVIGDVACTNIYKERFLGVQPSSEMIELFQYTWRRLYTWCIDDGIDNINAYKAQTHSIFNGMDEKVSEPLGIQQLQVIYLHGQIVKPDRGLIMTEVDYARYIKSDRHFWYQEAARDYLAYCPIFIGSMLEEPILVAELERAKRQNISSAGQAYLITPDDLTAIKSASLKARGIIHIKATLADFIAWLRTHYPDGIGPKDVVSATNNFDYETLRSLKSSDLEAAQALRPISVTDLHLSAQEIRFHNKANLARQFLQGFPPSWLVAASDVPVELEGLSALKDAIDKALEQKSEMFVTLGQSGSGKTTATMMALLKIIANNGDIALYDVAPDARSLTKAFSVLGRVETRRTIIHVGDLFLYGGAIRNDLEALRGKDVLVVGTARSSEWSEHLSRYLGDIASTHDFQRFTKPDFDPLIKRLVQYVPAPRFKRMTNEDRYRKFSSSRSQLLIALQEATESSNFIDIISSEFTNLPDDDTKRLLVLVGISTIARVGVSTAMARQAFEKFATTRSFDEALTALNGIVADGGAGRLFARHELYIRHVLEALTPTTEFFNAASNLLQTFSSYETPIIKFASRQDGLLFKFLLNHDFIFERAKKLSDRPLGIDYYSSNEIDFQLDGHFWLQYGLFLGRIGHDDAAVEMLTKSIRAYPDNLFAAHALADIQLKIARNSKAFDTRAKSLMAEAVATLNAQDARHETRTDQYPLVTLANGHVGCLIAHGQRDDAVALATDYYDRLTVLEKSLPLPAVKAARQRQLLFATTGDWDLRLKNSVSNAPSAKRKRNNRRKK